MAGVKQPDDKSHFILPDLGEGVHEAELIKWRVQVGDSVKELPGFDGCSFNGQISPADVRPHCKGVLW